MNDKIEELTLLAMKAEYDDQTLPRIRELLERIYVTDDIELIEDLSQFPKDGVEDSEFSYLPITINGEMQRFFKIKNTPNCLDSLKNKFLSALLSQMYTNIINFETVRKLAFFDALTGLSNRNSYERFIEEFNCERYKSLGCVFVDINDLCEINDNHGHMVGDDVIKMVASLIQKAFGTSVDAKIFRTGGDEFVIFLPDATKQILSDKIALVENPLDYIVEGTGAKVQISISIGMSIACGSIDITKVIERADCEMYRVKKVYHEESGTPIRKKRDSLPY